MFEKVGRKLSNIFGSGNVVDKATTGFSNHFAVKAAINASPSWFDMSSRDQLLLNYYQVPEYAGIKNYKARNFAALNYVLKDDNGEIVENSPVLDLLNEPNVYQTKSEFLNAYYLNLSVFGNTYVFKSVASSFKGNERIEDVKLFVLPAQYVYIKLKTNTPYNARTRNDLIDRYYLVVDGLTITEFEPDEILHINNQSLSFSLGEDDSNFLYGKSDQIPLNWALSNVRAIYEAENVLIEAKGALGIFSNDASGDGSYGFMDGAEKERFQSELEGYGLKHSKLKYIVTSLALKFNAISLPIKDMMLGDTHSRAVNAMCAINSFPRLLLNTGEDGTYENQQQAQKQLFENAIIPDAKEFIQGISKLLGLKDLKLSLSADYSHISALKEDEKLKAETDKTKNETCKSQYESGLITKNMWLTFMGLETVADSEFDKYKENGTDTSDATATDE